MKERKKERKGGRGREREKKGDPHFWISLKQRMRERRCSSAQTTPPCEASVSFSQLGSPGPAACPQPRPDHLLLLQTFSPAGQRGAQPERSDGAGRPILPVPAPLPPAPRPRPAPPQPGSKSLPPPSGQEPKALPPSQQIKSKKSGYSRAPVFHSAHYPNHTSSLPTKRGISGVRV